MAARGAEGARKATEAGTSVAERRFLCPAARRAGGTVFGSMTSCIIGPMTGGPFARSTSWTSSPGRAWQSGSGASLRRPTSSMSWRICSSCAASRPMSGPTTGPEFVAEAVPRWIAAVGARTAFIEPGSPWENGYIESFNARLCDELLNGEVFYTLRGAQVLIESWRRHYTAIRPQGSLGYRPPVPETIVQPSWPPGPATLRRPFSLAETPSIH